MKRTIMVSLAFVLGLTILGIFFLPVLLDLNRYRDRYLPVLEQALQRQIEVQDVHLTIFPKLGVRLRGIAIADDPSFSPTPFVTIPSAVVVVQWMPLLHRRIQVERILLQNPTVHVIRKQNGLWNTATIGKDLSRQPRGEGSAKNEDGTGPLLGVFAVEQFSTVEGTLRYEDRSQALSRSYQIDDLTFATNSVQIGQTANLYFQGKVMPSRLSLEVKGRFGPLQPNLDVPTIDMEGRLGTAEIIAAGKVLNGRLDLDVLIPHMKLLAGGHECASSD